MRARLAEFIFPRDDKVVHMTTEGCGYCSEQVELSRVSVDKILTEMIARTAARLTFLREARAKNAEVGFADFVAWLKENLE